MVLPHLTSKGILREVQCDTNGNLDVCYFRDIVSYGNFVIA